MLLSPCVHHKLSEKRVMCLKTARLSNAMIVLTTGNVMSLRWHLSTFFVCPLPHLDGEHIYRLLTHCFVNIASIIDAHSAWPQAGSNQPQDTTDASLVISCNILSDCQHLQFTPNRCRYKRSSKQDLFANYTRFEHIHNNNKKLT